MKHKGIKKRTEPFVRIRNKSAEDCIQKTKTNMYKSHFLDHSLKTLYIRIVKTS